MSDSLYDPSFKVLARQAIAEHRHRQLTTGYVFPLNATSIGLPQVTKIRARRLTMMDLAAIEALPMEVQGDVWRGMRAMEEKTQEFQIQGDAQNLMEAVKRNEESLVAANEFCIASWIQPRLVKSEYDLERYPGAWLLTDVAPEDRLTFFYACMNAASPAARLLELFRPPISADATGGVIDITPASGTHAEIGEDVPVAAPSFGGYVAQG